jgi:hypothetical protein
MFLRQLVVSTLALTSQEVMAKPLVAEPVVKPRIVQSRAIMNISGPLELKNITRVALPTLATRDVINRDVAVRGESGVSTYVEGRSSADASVVMGGLVTAAYGLAGTVCILGGLATAGAVCWASMVYAGIVTMFAFCTVPIS